MAKDGVLGVVRYDYAKFLVEIEPDRVQHYIDQWEGIMRFAQMEMDFDGNAKWKQVRGSHNALALYSFEAWGELSNAVMDLDWSTWHERCERLDVRLETFVVKNGLNEVYDHLSSTGATGRNVQRFDSRAKSKSGGRGTGGVGVAIGSHKSDFRATAYKRGMENGAIEYQLQGKRVQDGIYQVLWAIDHDMQDAVRNPWQYLRSMLFTSAEMELQKVTGIKVGDLLEVLAGNRTLDGAMETKLERVEGLIRELNKEGQVAILEAVQHMLYAE